MTKPNEENRLFESLDIGVRQLHHRDERIRDIGVSVDGLGPVADYLRELAEHGHAMRMATECPRGTSG